MWLQALQLLNPIGIIQEFREDRRHKRETKQAIQEKRLENIKAGKIAEAEWNQTSIKNAGWRAGYMTLAITIPVLAMFGPEALANQVALGFTRIGTLVPDWYVQSFGVAGASAFGVYAITDIVNSAVQKNKLYKAYTLPQE